jgi:hypothetical protein
MPLPEACGAAGGVTEGGTSGMKREITCARWWRSVSAGYAPDFAGGIGYSPRTSLRSARARKDGHVSGGILFATAWQTQTREAARSLISAVERDADKVVPKSLRSVCWRALVDGNGKFQFAQTATKFIAGVAMLEYRHESSQQFLPLRLSRGWCWR